MRKGAERGRPSVGRSFAACALSGVAAPSSHPASQLKSLRRRQTLPTVHHCDPVEERCARAGYTPMALLEFALKFPLGTLG